MRSRGLTVLLASALLAAPANAEEYAPLDRPGPALTIPATELRASLTCTDGVREAARAPVLLVPATTVTSRENFGWNWMPALRAAGIPYCATDQPGAAGQNMGDMQQRAEFIVYAIRRMHELAGRRISIVGHSQGGMVMRWPLRFWPDTRAMVEDVVGMAPTNHGSTVVNDMCIPGCAPALWQQRVGSAWNSALNSGQETFAGIDYTEIYSRSDEFVQPNADDTGTSSLRGGGGGRVLNVALQDVCPSDLNEHLLIGTTDATAWALGLDALTHDGPADERRIDPDVCRHDTMPGVDDQTGGVATAEAVARVATQLATAPRTDAEPPLRCYALRAGCPGQAVAPSRPTCRSRRRLTVRVDRLGLRGVRVTVDGRAVRVRGGIAVVDLRGRGPHRATVRITGRTARGRRTTVVRRYRTCRPSPAFSAGEDSSKRGRPSSGMGSQTAA